MKKSLYLIFVLFFTFSFLTIVNENKNLNSNTLPVINDSAISYYKYEYTKRYFDYKEKHPELNEEDIITMVNIGLDNDFYTNTRLALNIDTTYVLVNKYNYLPNDYIPKDLETISSNYSLPNKKLVKEARINFENMATNAQKEGYTIRCISAYRSYEYQQSLYNNYVKKDGVKIADTYSARPGFSEHQTGLAVDIDTGSNNYVQFATTKEFEWMKQNAYKYGYILRYTQKENITGYSCEPWHYRYVGSEIAAYIHFSNLTYDEYYAKFINE